MSNRTTAIISTVLVVFVVVVSASSLIALDAAARFVAGHEIASNDRAVFGGRRLYAAAAVSFALAEAGLIGGLLIERNRRRRAEGRNQAMVRTVPGMTFLISADGEYLDYHADDSSLLLVPPEKFLHQNVRAIMPPDLADRFFDAFARARSTGEACVVDYQLPLNGETRYYEARIVACGDGNMLSNVSDTTEGRRAGEALRRNDVALRASNDSARDLAGRLIAAQEVERARLARDLHDDLSQKVALLSIGIDQLSHDTDIRGRRARSQAQELKAQVNEIATDVHRLSHALHPSKLQMLGLVAAIDDCCRDVESHGHVAVKFQHRDVPAAIPNDVSLCLYRIVQEALGNIVKHSGAKVADVQLVGADQHLELRIADQGCGFAPEERQNGLGLVSMRERVRSVGGKFALHSTTGAGTRIGVRVPLPTLTDLPRQQIA